ncbi:MAG: protein kinase [Acidobacteriota bacterium]
MNRPSEFPETLGPYRLEALIGSGGMGEVYRAYDERLDRRVAVKHIRPDRGADPTVRQRLRREARAAAALAHPAIVQIFDILDTEDGEWIVMEHVDGSTLRELTHERPLEIPRALVIGQAVADGLAFAHNHGVIHRDLKTENVMLTHAGDRPKILDFGLAKRLSGSGSVDGTLTATGVTLGTCRAMSPEQAQGYEVDARSDLFAFGTLLYECLTGISPFADPSHVITLNRVCTHQQRPVASLRAELPAALSRLVDRLLEKLPEHRPDSAEEVAGELGALLQRGQGGPLRALVSESHDETLYLDPERNDPSPLPAAASDTKGSGAVVRTLLLTDLVASTRLFERLGDQRAVDVSSHHDRVARALFKQHGGFEIDKTDGFLVIFERPIDAVLCAVAYHRSLGELSKELGVDLQARAGIHLGEVFLRRNAADEIARGAKQVEMEGLAKPMAARVMALATGHQTLITRGAFDLARRAAADTGEASRKLGWLSHGDYMFKGIEEPVEVCEVGLEGLSPLRPPPDSEKSRRVPAEGDGVASRGSTVAPQARPGAWLAPRYGWLLGFVALVLVGSGTSTVWQRLQPDPRLPDQATGDFHQTYLEGIRLLERLEKPGDLDRAVNLLTALAEKDPQSASVQAALAKALWRKYRVTEDQTWLDRALTAGQKAVERGEYLALAHAGLANVYLEMGKLEVSRETYETALRLDPTCVDARWGLAKLHEHHGEADLAEEAYRRALEVQPDNRFILDGLGALLFKQARYSEARDMFERSIEVAPANVFGYANLAGVSFMRGDLEAAAAILQQGLEIRPSSYLYTNLGNIFFYQGKYQESIAPYRKAIDLDHGALKPEMWRNLGDAYRWTSGYEEEMKQAYSEAIDLVRASIETRPDDPDLQGQLAVYQARRGDWSLALATAARLEERGQLGPSTLILLAATYEQCGERPRALAALGTALEMGYPYEAVAREQELDRLRADPLFAPLSERYGGDSAGLPAASGSESGR